ncbi:hypothetical protein CWI37_0148p0050 [Hamiltosporidium tvaerminnensis]|uniref:Leucine-rich repeat-containing protein n=1 Tax=Hamiltosporidium tvaerminnensis TaxID=1176355 RepID=A0A4Q9L9D9_9MICR|nr:hypothetical protein CWI37_0148p0050 [Hamiltosporidium tvaerminnensis]
MTHWTSNRRLDRSSSLPIFFTNYSNERIEETIRSTTAKLINCETDLLRWDVCDLEEYPIEIRQLQRINRDRNIRISICCNSLKYISKYLISDSVVELSLQFNKISKIPQSICKMKKLKLLNLSNNCIKTIPAEILCMKLDVLFLENNCFFGGEIVQKLNEKEKMKIKFFKESENEKNIFGGEIVQKLNEKEKMKIKFFKESENEKNIFEGENMEGEGCNGSVENILESFKEEEVKNTESSIYLNSFLSSNNLRSKFDNKNTKSLANTCKDKLNVKDDIKEVYCSVCGNMTDYNLHFYENICREGINVTLEYVLCSEKCYYEQLNV